MQQPLTPPRRSTSAVSQQSIHDSSGAGLRRNITSNVGGVGDGIAKMDVTVMTSRGAVVVPSAPDSLVSSVLAAASQLLTAKGLRLSSPIVIARSEEGAPISFDAAIATALPIKKTLFCLLEDETASIPLNMQRIYAGGLSASELLSAQQQGAAAAATNSTGPSGSSLASNLDELRKRRAVKRKVTTSSAHEASQEDLYLELAGDAILEEFLPKMTLVFPVFIINGKPLNWF
ncbi:hypothetical protein BC829DRAFT_14140 [Chytridium lagenaria]|nr:hypothetical protein BC829DRAFT_14140 [Chytridium lagenaria]